MLKARHPRLPGNDELSGLMDNTGFLSAFPAAPLIFLLPLSAAPPGLLLLTPIGRSLLLALRPWRLHFTLYSTWPLPVILDRRAPLLGRGVDRGWSRNVFGTPGRWLRAWGSRNDLLGRH